MPKVIDKRELDQIAAILGRGQRGLGIAEIERECRAKGLKYDRRTLQRRVGDLVAAGCVLKQGEGRAVRYRINPVTGTGQITEAPDVFVTTGEVYVPLSPAGEKARALVRRPLTERKPVGYHRAFLERYEPNKSAYLPAKIHAHLQEIGRSPVAHRAAGTYARDILNRLLIDLSWASSRLEGNTYTRLDTQNLIEFGQAAEGKNQREAQMILNHKAAIEMLVEHAKEIGFNTFTFLNLHAILSDNLMADPAASGRLRGRIVEISKSVFHPLGNPQQIDEFFNRILDKADAIQDPFEQAFFVMVHIPYLQPFEDVNKRVSRLAANIPLIRRNLSPLSFVDVPERAYVEGTLAVYEVNRIELLRDVFVWAYERSCQRYVAVKESIPEPDPLRLRYREALIEVVSEVVRAGKPIDMRLIREIAAPLVKPEDLEQFVAMAFNDLHYLYEGNVARYRLRLSEFKRWKEALPGGEKMVRKWDRSH